LAISHGFLSKVKSSDSTGHIKNRNEESETKTEKFSPSPLFRTVVPSKREEAVFSRNGFFTGPVETAHAFRAADLQMPQTHK